MTKYRIVKRETKDRGGNVEIDYFIERTCRIIFFDIWIARHEIDREGECEIEYFIQEAKALAKIKKLEEECMSRYNSKITKITKTVL